MQGVGLWRTMELSPRQRHWGDMVTLRVWNSDRQDTRKSRCEVGLELIRGALSVLGGAGLASVLGCWASWDTFPGLRVFMFALGK